MQDTNFHSTFDETLEVFASLGFTVVSTTHFTGKFRDEEETVDEKYVVLWHEAGVLATCESYHFHNSDVAKVNEAKMFYNWEPNDGARAWDYLSSGHTTNGVFIGKIDASIDLAYNFNRFQKSGNFLPKWIESPRMWLLTYMESEGKYDYKAINEERIAGLPEHVRNAITVSN